MQPPPAPGGRAFTRIELLAVLAVLAVLTFVAVPALAQSARHGRTAVCLAHLMRLASAWNQYTTDHEGRVPSNNPAAPGATNWCGGSWINSSQPSDPNNWDHD